MNVGKKVCLILGVFLCIISIAFAKSHTYITAETVSHHTYLLQQEKRLAERTQTIAAYDENQVTSDVVSTISVGAAEKVTVESTATGLAAIVIFAGGSDMLLIWGIALLILVACIGVTKLSGNLL